MNKNVFNLLFLTIFLELCHQNDDLFVFVLIFFEF